MKRFGLSIFVLLALAVFSFGQTTPTTWQGWGELGFQQYDKKDFDGAIKSFSECIRLNGGAGECYAARGMVYQTKRNLEAAIADLTKALEIFPNDADTLIALAECYNDDRKYDLAVLTTTKGISLSLNQPKAKNLDQFHHVRALANFNLKKYTDAVADATKALNLGGRQFREDYRGQTYFIRSLAYCQTGEFDLAVYDEKKAKDLGYKINKPCNETDSLLAAGKEIKFDAIGKRAEAELHIFNGLGASIDGKFDQAIAHYTKAIEASPTFTEGYFKRAEAYFTFANKPQLAKADVEQVLKLNPNHEEALELKKTIDAILGTSSTVTPPAPNNPNIPQKTAQEYYNLAAQYNVQGKYELAETEINQAIALAPNDAKSYWLRAYVRYSLKKEDASMEDYNQSIKLDPNNGWIRYDRGGVYFRSNQYDLAIADFTRAIELDPKNHDFLRARGYTYLMKKDYTRSIADYNTALAIKPADSTLWTGRGHNYYYTGNYEAALVDYSKAVELDPTKEYHFANRGIAYFALNKFNLAAADLQQALKLNPNYQPAKDYLAKIK